MDKTVIEKNRIKIFNGLTAVLLVQDAPISLIGHKAVATKMTAPNIAISQYVSIVMCLILMCGKNNIDRVIPKNVIPLIIIVATIFTNEYHSPLFYKGNKKSGLDPLFLNYDSGLVLIFDFNVFGVDDVLVVFFTTFTSILFFTNSFIDTANKTVVSRDS